MQWTLHTALSIVSMVVCLGVAALLWKRQDRPGARSLFAFTVAAAVWAGGNALQVGSTTLTWTVISLHVQYVAIAAVPVTWFAFAAEYTGQRRWLRPRILAAIAIPLVVLVLLEWTNASHGLVRTSTELATYETEIRLERTFGPAFWLGVLYSNLVLASGTILLLRALVRTRRVYARQVVTILVAATVPWVANVAYISGNTTIEPEVFYAVTAIGFAFAVTRYQLFDLTPVARSTVLDELPDPVFVVDAATRIVDVNAAAAQVTGSSEQDLLGERFEDVLPDHADVLDGQAEHITVETDTNGTRVFAPRISPVGTTAGSGQVVVLRNVTNLAESRADLQRRNDQLEHVADVMSHDLRSPLNVAKGRLQLAMEDAPPDIADDLQTVADAHDRMDNIIESTLRAARATLGSADTTEVALQDACVRAWRTADVGDMTKRFECEDVVVEADTKLLTTLLENLFRNAATHGNASEVRVTATDDGFVIEDDGIGFGEADVDRVMERGYTTSHDGTGLGLAIVQDVAETHGWTIEVGESESGGAMFRVAGVTVTRRPTGSAPRSRPDT